MILPNKDVPFEKSLLKYSIDVLNSINEKISVEDLYKSINIRTKDMDAIMVFLYAINKIEVKDEWVIKIDKKNI